MDLTLDGHINRLEFGHFIQHLQRLRDGEERLRLYLIPMDTNGDDQLEPNELDRLLRSVGQTNLTSAETTLVYANHPEGLSWRSNRLQIAAEWLGITGPSADPLRGTQAKQSRVRQWPNEPR